MATENVQTFTDGNFDDSVLKSGGPVLVDFWAEWCGPCKMITPILEEIAVEQVGKVRIAKLNVDDNPDAARRFEVMSIPTLIVFRDGLPVKRMIGAKGKGQLLQELSEFIDIRPGSLRAGDDHPPAPCRRCRRSRA
jgi:thioredoxin 1